MNNSDTTDIGEESKNNRKKKGPARSNFNKNETWYCRSGNHMATGPKYPNPKLGWNECERHTAYLKGE